MLRIRRAEARDAGVVLDLVRALAEYEKVPHAVKATEGDLVRDGFSGSPRFFVELAEWEGEPVGFALWFFNYSTWLGRPGLWLEDLFVRPGHRGRGVGRALLAHVAGIAVEEGCGRFEWAVLDWNAPAIAFYRALGAKPLDEWTTMRVTGEALSRLARTGDRP